MTTATQRNALYAPAVAHGLDSGPDQNAGRLTAWLPREAYGPRARSFPIAAATGPQLEMDAAWKTAATCPDCHVKKAAKTGACWCPS